MHSDRRQPFYPSPGQKEGSIDQEGLTRFGPLESFKEAAACGGIVASQEMVDRLRSIGVADDQLLPAYPEASLAHEGGDRTALHRP